MAAFLAISCQSGGTSLFLCLLGDIEITFFLFQTNHIHGGMSGGLCAFSMRFAPALAHFMARFMAAGPSVSAHFRARSFRASSSSGVRTLSAIADQPPSELRP